MEEYDDLPYQHSTGCSRCNAPEYEPGYAFRLCKTCRKKLSRYPVKKEIIWATIGVGVILLVAIFRLPGYFHAGVGYMKGKKLVEEHKYLSAEKYFKATLKKFPDHLGAMMHLIKASYLNDNEAQADSLLALAGGRDIPADDEELQAMLDFINDHISHSRIEDKTLAQTLTDIEEDTAAYRAKLDSYVVAAPYDLAAKTTLAYMYEDLQLYEKADSLCAEVIHKDPLLRSAYYERLSALRDLGKYKEGLKLAEDLLSQNTESIQALMTLTSFQLRLNMHQQALLTIRQAAALAPEDSSVLFMLALACHYNRQQDEAHGILAKLKNRPDADTSSIALLHSYITDKVSYK